MHAFMHRHLRPLRKRILGLSQQHQLRARVLGGGPGGEGGLCSKHKPTPGIQYVSEVAKNTLSMISMPDSSLVQARCTTSSLDFLTFCYGIPSAHGVDAHNGTMMRSAKRRFCPRTVELAACTQKSEKRHQSCSRGCGFNDLYI